MDWNGREKKKNEISYRCPLPILNFDCAQKIEWRNERQNWKADRNEWKFKGTKKRKNRSTFRRNNLILNRIEFKITIAQRMELSFFSSSFTSFNTFPIPQRMKEFLLKCWIKNWRIYLFLSDLFLNLSFNRFVRAVTHRMLARSPNTQVFVLELCSTVYNRFQMKFRNEDKNNCENSITGKPFFLKQRNRLWFKTLNPASFGKNVFDKNFD